MDEDLAFRITGEEGEVDMESDWAWGLLRGAAEDGKEVFELFLELELDLIKGGSSSIIGELSGKLESAEGGGSTSRAATWFLILVYVCENSVDTAKSLASQPFLFFVLSRSSYASTPFCPIMCSMSSWRHRTWPWAKQICKHVLSLASTAK